MTNSQSRMRSQRQLPIFRQWQNICYVENDSMPPTTKTFKSFSASKICPTYSGALEWIRRNCDVITTSLRLVQIYPNLIQDESLDCLWEFLQPFMEGTHGSNDLRALKDNEREQKCSKGDDSSKEDSTTSVTNGSPSRYKSEESCGDSSSQRTTLFVCGSLSDGNVNIAGTNTERIIAALSPFCYIRSNAAQLQGNFSEIYRNVSSADAFIFVMNDKTLYSDVCIHHLGIAVAANVPIIAVREPGFKLPKQLPEQFYMTEIIKTVYLKPPSKIIDDEGLSDSRDGAQVGDAANVDLETTQQTLLLSDVVRECFQSSQVYIPTFHDSCIGKLFGKLSDYLGDLFLDLEISRSHQLGNSQILTQDGVSEMNGNVFRTRRKEAVPTTSSISSGDNGSGESHNNLPHGKTSPRSPKPRLGHPKHTLKLPPIQTQNHLATSSNTTKNNSSTKLTTTSDIEDRMPEPVFESDAVEIEHLHLSASPEPLETNYLICPNRSLGNTAKEPFLVSFPTELNVLDNKVSDYLNSVSPTLTYVKLDLEYRSASSSPVVTTPNATPTPQRTCKLSRTKETSINQDQSLSTTSPQNHIPRQTTRNNRSRRFDKINLSKPKSRSKDSMEIARVTLQYNVPPVMRQNSLR